jgi:beta-fructofuranosidase
MDNKNYCKLINNEYREIYHISAPQGWINDPNGFCYFKGYYHIFYQYHPYSSSWGPMHWGHARSRNLVEWETLPIALKPDDKEDGCFSGSAIVKDDILYLIYTGHHYYEDDDPEHFWQNQNMAYSEDGINFIKYEKNPIIKKAPDDNTHHFRDPKVWERDGTYYMILGSQSKLKKGRVILYKSANLKSWEYIGVVTSSNELKKEGFMWECPDLFRLNGKDVLITSPMGIRSTKKDYLNLYQTGYFVGNYNYEKNEYQRGNFFELDKGHDFYATQTMISPDGRRLAFSWMDMWESETLEAKDGWAGTLTLPRELVMEKDRVYMRPIEEIKQLRVNKLEDKVYNLEKECLDRNITRREICINIDIARLKQVKFKLSFQDDQIEILNIVFDKENLEWILNKLALKKDQKRYATVSETNKISIRIFIDTSSVEIFINNGEVVFTERIYVRKNLSLWLEASQTIKVTTKIYQLKDNVIQYKL